MTLDNGDRDYWKGVDLGDEFDQCKEEINEAIEDFTKGAIDYFLESPSSESDKPHYYNLGKQFGDYLYCTQEDMIIDGKHKSLHGG